MPQPGLADQEDLSPDEQIEVQADQRRRVVAAFVLGSEARPNRHQPRPLVPQLAGLAIALAIAVGIALTALVQQQIKGGQSPAGSRTPTPLISATVQPTQTPGPLLATPPIRPTGTPVPARTPLPRSRP
jgi:hypothetical protein